MATILPENKEFIHTRCPHCDGVVIIHVNEMNCRIFRHAVYKSSGNQVSPHAPKIECDSLRQNDQVHGCCRPFCLNSVTNEAEVCDYI